MDFVEVYRPLDQGQLAMVKRILNTAELNYDVENETFSQSYPGLGALAMRVMVQSDHAEKAKELINEHL